MGKMTEQYGDMMGTLIEQMIMEPLWENDDLMKENTSPWVR